MDFEEINKIIKLLEDKNLAEFELEIDGFKIKIGRNNSNIAQAAVAYQPAAAPAAGIPGLVPETGPEMRGDAHAVVSPMVGTFYRAPSPSSPPFVDVGDVVKKRQILCIVEAMKLMNEIESDADGVIKEICVENGKPVEYGQKLFVIVPQA
ncbi:MAG: acetyl-CoA carboxylase biotin carboxyl carrier protein [Candidatus Aminicenantes bacterium]|nr:acetyl-CoA carboxylase biotin carboxyl carrier protein [Candidatus Aminicenantes bacterium]